MGHKPMTKADDPKWVKKKPTKWVKKDPKKWSKADDPNWVEKEPTEWEPTDWVEGGKSTGWVEKKAKGGRATHGYGKAYLKGGRVK